MNDRWQEYEKAKREYDDLHPDSTSAERDAYLRKVAEKLGV